MDRVIYQDLAVAACDDGGNVLLHTDIAVENGRIADIGSGLRGGREILCTDCLAVPLLCNMHLHLGETILRGVCDGKDLFGYLDVSHGIYEQGEWKTHKEAIHRCVSYVTLIEALRSGTGRIATIRSWQECADSRIAAVCGYPVINIAKLKQYYDGFDEDALAEIAQTYPDVTQAVFIQSLYTIGEEQLLRVAEYLRRHPEVPVFIHICETEWELAYVREKYGCSPIAYMDRIGLFSAHTFCIHCVHITDEEIGILKRRRAAAVLCPTSNLKLLNGVPPTEKLFRSGIPVCLGTDGLGTNNSASIPEALKILALTAGSPVLTAQDYLNTVTRTPCEVLGIFDRTGSIEIGKQADLTILQTDPVHLFSSQTAVSNFVYDPASYRCRCVIRKGIPIYTDESGCQYLDEAACTDRFLDAARLLFEG